jgi:hypothetical protein
VIRPTLADFLSDEILLEADGAGTLMTMRMTLPDGKTRAAMLATGMERGMEASYVRLEGMLQDFQQEGNVGAGATEKAAGGS